MNTKLIRKATINDVQEIKYIYSYARKFMEETGNTHQWTEGYPQDEIIERDLASDSLHVIIEEQNIIGCFSMFVDGDPDYKVIDGRWLNEEPYVVIHRVAATEGKKEILRSSVEYAFKFSDNVRIDTHEDNHVMRAALSKLGFTYCGIVQVRHAGDRMAFQLVLK